MRLAFYAPLKPPDHPVPSGDRRVARQAMAAFELAGHDIELAARLRSYDRGDTQRQMRLAAIGGRLAARYVHHLHSRPFAQRPQAWITYHLYHKAADWIGPRVAARLSIPYIVLEASVAGKRSGGPWSFGHEATIAALARAAAVISLNPRDEPGIAPHVATAERLYRLKPFLDARPYSAAAAARAALRAATARRFGLDPQQPWLLAVGMMRSGDKLESYKILAEALAAIDDPLWSLLVVGDGPARDDVRAAFAGLGPRVVFAGMLEESALPPLYAACDLYVWPAVNEAFGMAILEAQAAGLPAIAGDSGGVGEIIADGQTGRLVKARDAAAMTAGLKPLLANRDLLRTWLQQALLKVAAEHDLPVAAKALDAILTAARRVGAYA